MSERDDWAGPPAGIGLAVAAVMSCSLPVLIGSGVLASVVGVGLGTWLLIVAALLVIGGLVTWPRRGRGHAA